LAEVPLSELDFDDSDVVVLEESDELAADFSAEPLAVPSLLAESPLAESPADALLPFERA
jgi:hypothetical protein